MLRCPKPAGESKILPAGWFLNHFNSALCMLDLDFGTMPLSCWAVLIISSFAWNPLPAQSGPRRMSVSATGTSGPVYRHIRRRRGPRPPRREVDPKRSSNPRHGSSKRSLPLFPRQKRRHPDRAAWGIFPGQRLLTAVSAPSISRRDIAGQAASGRPEHRGTRCNNQRLLEIICGPATRFI